MKFWNIFKKVGKNVWVLGLGEGFLHVESKNIIHERRENWTLQKFYIFLHEIHLCQGWEAATSLEKLFASHTSDKSLKVYKRLSKVNKNRNNSIRKCRKDMKRHFTRRGHLFDKQFMKRHSKLLVFVETQIRNTMRIIPCWFETIKLKTKFIVSEYANKLDFS